MQFTLYIKPWCPWCVDAVAWLKARGYQFKTIDVLTDALGYARMKKISNQSLTPTLETSDGKVLPDFGVDQLEKFLTTHGITPAKSP